MQATVELARRIAELLGEIEGVVAVALGGSWARGEVHPGSDVDLGIYYRDERRPSIEDLHRLARELGYRYPTEPVTDFGGWGPWIQRRRLAAGGRNAGGLALPGTRAGIPRHA